VCVRVCVSVAMSARARARVCVCVQSERLGGGKACAGEREVAHRGACVLVGGAGREVRSPAGSCGGAGEDSRGQRGGRACPREWREAVAPVMGPEEEEVSRYRGVRRCNSCKIPFVLARDGLCPRVGEGGWLALKGNPQNAGFCRV
jgi:hypothetical protein